MARDDPLFFRAADSLNNERVMAYGEARARTVRESERKQFYLLPLFVLFGSRARHSSLNCEFCKAIQRFAHSSAISLNLSRTDTLLQVQC